MYARVQLGWILRPELVRLSRARNEITEVVAELLFRNEKTGVPPREFYSDGVGPRSILMKVCSGHSEQTGLPESDAEML